MAVKKARSKKYRPRPICPMPINWRGDADPVELSLRPLLAIDNIMKGVAILDDLKELQFRLRIVLTLAKLGINSVDDHDTPIAYLESAVIATAMVAARLEATGKVGCTGEELQALRYGLEMADLLQGAATRRELSRAVRVECGLGDDILAIYKKEVQQSQKSVL